jgi:broad specificity phosphatase PhoE
MTTFLLIRHGACDPVGRSLAGRAPGVSLNAQGVREAEALASRLAPLPLAQVFSSPLERAMETAAAVARRHGLGVELRDGLTELDFGEWTGRSFEELAAEPRWRQFNEQRSRTRIPGGELMAEAQMRAVAELEGIRLRRGEGLVAVVTHADVLRGIVAYYAGIPLDLSARLDVATASVSVLVLGATGAARLVCLNHTGDLPER